MAGCTQLSTLIGKTVSQVKEAAEKDAVATPAVSDTSEKVEKYPDSAMIYHVCHERWLRNGYANYTFNIEEGTYHAGQEIQRGRFTQTVVANHSVKQVATCEITYHEKGGSCDQGTRKRLTRGRTIEGFFAKWEKNPGLYQSCHPVLGYPTGYGHTYGSGKRRIDSSNWLLISSVIPRRASLVTPRRNIGGSETAAQSAETGANTASVVAMKTREGDQGRSYASVMDIDIKLLASHVEKKEGKSILESRFDVINPTSLVALLGIKGWIIDKDYQRFPLSIDGKTIQQGQAAQVYPMKVEPHTQTTVSYRASGIPDIFVGKRTAAILEIMSADGAKVNVTLPGSLPEN